MEKEKAILLKINGELKEIGAPSFPGDTVEEIFPASPEALDVYRHSCSHLLAQAVLELFPGTQVGVGPAVENGFYYDFLTARPFSEGDLAEISKKMAHLAKQNQPIRKEIWKKDKALQYFAAHGQLLKTELLNEKVEGDDVSVYVQGGFVDLCRGPHLPATGLLKHFKLLSVAAAYWKGDEKSHSLQRVYGTVFPDAAGLDEHLRFLKEAKERDHRRLGKKLDLFSLQEEAGPGLVYWHPKGARVRHEIEDFWKQRHYQSGYELLYTPHIGREWLWETSGHLEFYKDTMYAPMAIDELNYLPQADELPVPPHDLQDRASAPTATCPCAGPSWARSTATSAAARCTACCACAASRRTTPTSSAPPSRSTRRSCARSTSPSTCCSSFGFSEFKIELSVRDPQIAGKYAGSDAMWVEAEASLVKALTVRRAALPAHGGRGRLLRAQDRHQDQGRPGPRLADAPPSSSTSTCRSASA